MLLFRVSLAVTLRRVNEEACSGDDLTFSCEATESGLLVWTLTALSGVIGVVDSFGQSLNSDPNAVRITSTDSSSGPNLSSITIKNVTAADNGARVQCRSVNMEMSNIITLSIRKCRNHQCRCCMYVIIMLPIFSASLTRTQLYINNNIT